MKVVSDKSILIGNGFNINFGGKAYSNEYIIKRMIFNALEDKYSPLFDGQMQGSEIVRIILELTNLANKISAGKYDSIIPDGEQEILENFKKRYNFELKHCYEIGLEDYFFVLHVFFLENKDLVKLWRSAKQGFEHMILDAIYNDGDIQRLHENINNSVKTWLLEYNNIFTLNYDNNIEELIDRQVFHLHGDYRTLANSENPETILGFIRKDRDQRVIISGFEHCYCNALLDYADGHKYEIAYAFEKGEIGLRALEHSGIPTKYFLAPISELMNVHQDHPELSFGCSYHFDKFRTLTGELHIVGVSPNNDDHIFKLINKSKIEKVVFYYYAENEKNKKIPVHQEIEFKNVHELWKNLKALPKQHNSSYSIPILR